MYPKLFGVLNSYGLMIGIGILVCLAVYHFYAKKKNIDPAFIDFTEWLAIIAIIFGFVSSAIFQSFYNYIDNPSKGFDNGLETILGVVLAIVVVGLIFLYHYIAKKKNISEEKVEKFDYAAVICVAISMLLPTVVSALVKYIKSPADGLNLDVGITFLGGLIGGVVSFLVIYFWKRNKFKSKLLDELSIAPCVITVAHGFGRIGCFLAGCCYGKTTGTNLDMAFPVWNIDYTKVLYYDYHLPTQLYEAIFLFLIFGIMSFLLLKFDFKHNMSIYLISYGVWRFIIEFYRGDARGSFIGNISPSQFWSIIMVIAGILLWIILGLYYKKKAEPIKEVEKVDAE